MFHRKYFGRSLLERGRAECIGNVCTFGRDSGRTGQIGPAEDNACSCRGGPHGERYGLAGMKTVPFERNGFSDGILMSFQNDSLSDMKSKMQFIFFKIKIFI